MKKLVLSAALSTMVLASATAHATHRHSKDISSRYKAKICYGFSQARDSSGNVKDQTLWHQALEQAVSGMIYKRLAPECKDKRSGTTKSF